MKIFIIDDNESIRVYLATLLQTLNVATSEFGSAEEFMASNEFDGILLCDLRLPGISGLDLHEWVMQQNLFIPMVLISAFTTTNVTVKAIKMGVTRVIEKPIDEDELWEAVQDTLAFYQRNVEQQRAKHEAIRRLRTLSPQEMDVLHTLLDGISNKDIETQLNISGFTLRRCRDVIFEKMGVDSLAALIIKATLAVEQEDPKRNDCY